MGWDINYSVCNKTRQLWRVLELYMVLIAGQSYHLKDDFFLI